MGKRTTDRQLSRPLIYELRNPNYTIYHRAALGGLAATVQAWKRKPKRAPLGVCAEVRAESVEISWDDSLTSQEVIRRILEASFQLTKDKLIDLPGHGIEADRDDLRLAIHTGLCGTFLQHHKMRPGEKAPRMLPVRDEGDEDGHPFSYKAVNAYAHQKAQGTDLFDEKLNGALPQAASIPQSVVPGAMSGATGLEASPEETLLLMYLMVGSSIFLLRPRSYQDKAQYCFVAPDVTNLTKFADNLREMSVLGDSVKRFGNTYLGRVVGGAEEAALRFLIDLEADSLTNDFESCVSGCLAVAMGQVAWDKNQINRSIVVRIKSDYPEIGVFRAAAQHFSKARILTLKKGEKFALPPSPLPELIAANLAAERHWCAHFVELCKEQKDFTNLKFQKGGLAAMNKAIKDGDDQIIVTAFHEAWRLTMGAIGERARNDGLDFSRLIEVERERTRNAILRAKTTDALASWFLRFCADATKGASLSAMKRDANRIREFIFNQRNFERFQNLCLFALVSYSAEDAKNNTQGETEA
jgi:CRISPR-associated protein Cas8a1/Csx13